MPRIPMNIRRMNFFFFGDRCNTTHPFYSFARIYRLSSRNHFHPRAQRALRALHLLKQCPTPSSNRGSGTCTAQAILIEVAPPRLQPRQRHAHSAGYYISHAPAESRSAGCGARRKAVRLSGRRHGVAPWASVKLPLRPAFRSQQACPSKARQAPAYPRACPSREAQAREYPEASRPSPRPRCRYPQRVCPWGSTSWSKARPAQVFPRAYPSRESQAQAYPEASRPSLRPRCRYPQRVFRSRQAYPSKAQPAQAFPRACPSREAQAQVCPEASQPSPRPRNPSKARVLPAYRRPWANRPVARWRRASFCRAARSSRRGPSQRGRDECATRGGTPRAPA